jgi:hypothetical protein
MSVPDYPADDRKADVRKGRRDGRRQLPTYSEIVELLNADAEVTTPYQKVLISSGRHQIGEEYKAFLRAVDGYLLRRASLRADLVTAQHDEQRARDALVVARAELTDAELQPRSPHELAMGGQQLRGRRAAMREHRIALAEQALAMRTAAVESRKKEIEETSEMIDKLFAHAQANARKLADYSVLRIATYWDALVQTHSEGRNIAPMLPPVTFPLPAWVEAMCWVGDVAATVQEVTP